MKGFIDLTIASIKTDDVIRISVRVSEILMVCADNNEQFCHTTITFLSGISIGVLEDYHLIIAVMEAS